MRYFQAAVLLLFSGALFAGETTTISLSNAIHIALNNNLSIKQMEKDLAIAQSQYAESLADLWVPKLAASFGLTFLDPDTVNLGIVSASKITGSNTIPAYPPIIPVSMTFPTTSQVTLTNVYMDNYAAGLTLTKALFTGFKLWNASQIRLIAIDLAKRKLADQKLATVYNVETSFYNLFLIRENLKITEDLDKSLHDRLNFVRVNYNAGQSSEYDLIRMQVQYQNNQPNLIQASNAYEIAKMAFCELLEISNYQDVVFTGSLLDSTNFQVIETNAGTLLGQALSNDINLAAIDIGLQQLRYTKDITDAAKYPTLAGVFNYNLNYKKTNTYQDDRNWNSSWNIGLQLSVPIDDWIPVVSRTWNASEEMKTAIEKSVLGRQQYIEGLDLQVKTLLLQIRQSRETMVSQKENVRQAKVAYDMANEKYREGTIASLDLTDAQVSYSQAEANYLLAIYNYFNSNLRLLRMLGY